MADLLFEIGLEEVPARMIAGAEAELLRRTVALLGREWLLPEGFDELSGAKSYSTPRRLAVLVRGVRGRQEDVSEEVTGPAVKIAFKDGAATPAAEAFARKNGVAVADLKTVTTPKGEYIAATSTKAGRTAAEVIAAELPKEVGAIYWAKNMYWRAGKPERFVRPVLWLVCLLGEEVVPVSFGGRTAGRATFGHRVLASGEAFEIESPESYEAQLAGEYVVVDVEARRHKIRKALDYATREIRGARWREDEALVDQVTHLTEWPSVLLGNFEAEYLALPEEVLVTVMRDHQKYFAVEDAEGKLAPHFLTVLNISTDEKSAAIIRQGNERVLRARFNDARFFWEFDQRLHFTERLAMLENVTFQKDLGTYAEKSRRVKDLAVKLGQLTEGRSDFGTGEVITVFSGALSVAAEYAKVDLTTELVKEFTELQGVIGGLYAAAQGFPAIVAEAIYDQYMPASMDDGVPHSIEGALLGIADRADTIAGMFGLGLEPTGSKDPFALRRAANGVVKILAEKDLPLTLDEVISQAVRVAAKPEASDAMTSFFRERVEFYMRETLGLAKDAVASVLAARWLDVPLTDAIARVEAVIAARGGDDFAAVSAAFKRMKNILEQTKFEVPLLPFVPAGVGAEDNLYIKFLGVKRLVKQFSEKRQYVKVLEVVAQLRPEVDAFFDEVKVVDDDETVRQRRLTLLSEIVGSLGQIADFSLIVTAG